MKRSIDLVSFVKKEEFEIFGVCLFDRQFEGEFAEFVRKNQLQNLEENSHNWHLYHSSSFYSPISPHYIHHCLPYNLDHSIIFSRNMKQEERISLVVRLVQLIRNDQFDKIHDEIQRMIVGQETRQK